MTKPILWLMGGEETRREALGQALVQALRRQGVAAEIITGADVAANLAHGLADSPEDQETLQRRVGFLGHLLARNEVVVILTPEMPSASVWEDLQRDPGGYRAVLLGDAGVPQEVWMEVEEKEEIPQAADRLLAAMTAEGWLETVGR